MTGKILPVRKGKYEKSNRKNYIYSNNYIYCVVYSELY